MGEPALTLIPQPTFIPFTRIKGISERKRLPIIGKIRLGVLVNGKNGLVPQETPYFIVPPEVADVYGNKPTEIDVIFMLDDEIRMFPQALKMYGASGLKCIGNGEQASRLNERTYRFEPFHTCTCEMLITRDCNKRANLLVMIPRISHGGLYQIDTGSQDSINNINGYFEFLKMTIGRIANIPLKLRRVPHLSPYQGRMQTHYPLVLRYEGSPELTEQLKQETTDVLARLTTLDVQEAIDINPATDTDATIVAEEDLASVMTVHPLPQTPQDPPSTPPSPQAASDFVSPQATDQKSVQPMTIKQRKFILELVRPKGIGDAHVDAITRGYNKRQASGLIEQLQTGDFSGLEEVTDEELPINHTTPTHPDAHTPQVVEF
jgi:hypothetical protein